MEESGWYDPISNQPAGAASSALCLQSWRQSTRCSTIEQNLLNLLNITIEQKAN